ncbi:MAG: hypothetical protein ACMXYK_04350 [Candidatus Woesearchaeota archaeon]
MAGNYFYKNPFLVFDPSEEPKDVPRDTTTIQGKITAHFESEESMRTYLIENPQAIGLTMQYFSKAIQDFTYQAYRLCKRDGIFFLEHPEQQTRPDYNTIGLVRRVA